MGQVYGCDDIRIDKIILAPEVVEAVEYLADISDLSRARFLRKIISEHEQVQRVVESADRIKRNNAERAAAIEQAEKDRMAAIKQELGEFPDIET
jgi:hypothetical protein